MGSADLNEVTTNKVVLEMSIDLESSIVEKLRQIRNIFDKDLHDRLLWKVTLHGIQGEIADWMEN